MGLNDLKDERANRVAACLELVCRDVVRLEYIEVKVAVPNVPEIAEMMCFSAFRSMIAHLPFEA